MQYIRTYTSFLNEGFAVVIVLFLMGNPLYAWYGRGHVRVTRATVTALRGHMPVFFINGREIIAHGSVDPDVFKINRDYTSLYRSEYPEHFFDKELFTDNTFPATRTDFWWWCLQHKVYTNQIGTLPYALMEWTSRLSISLAEYRQWPLNQAIQSKCLVYAGILAHYAQDLCMPLHTTIHYDGRVLEGNTSPRTGIHNKVDALLEKVQGCTPLVMDHNDLLPYERISSGIFAQLEASHALVEEVYRLEPQLPEVEAALIPDSVVSTFACERWTAAAHFTARLYVTAWDQSADIHLPSWLQREETLDTSITDPCETQNR